MCQSIQASGGETKVKVITIYQLKRILALSVDVLLKCTKLRRVCVVVKFAASRLVT